MTDTKSSMIEKVVHTAQLLSSSLDLERIISIVTEQALDSAGADVAGFYLKGENQCPLAYSRGRDKLPSSFNNNNQMVDFMIDCGDPLFSLGNRHSFMSDMFISDNMQSAAVLPLVANGDFFGFVLLNSRKANLFNNERLQFLEGISKMAAGLMMNSKIHQEMKIYLEKIEIMERYQQNIFSSMTNLLITLDHQGNIQYFNQKAKQKLNMNDACIGVHYKEFFKNKLSTRVLNRLERARKAGRTLLGVEGIFDGEGFELDYSMNFSPLEDLSDGYNGNVILLTDQTAERGMEKEVSQAKEDRRIIKDVFSRYLSSDLVHTLTQSPESVHLGGDKKRATIFFADICGYTSFSEGKEPEFILSVLNGFFNEAVDIILKKKGYIDKFIGDCIMAAWGVPMETEQADARNAVDCALSLQEIVASKDRSFFRDAAEDLKIAIGMHTGPLVAGNIGGSARMDYSVIGDTVNVAARLEGVSTAGEIIITQQTYDLVQDYFLFEKREPVLVKGKAQPLQIYNVIGRK